jgi:hypothetical protein
VVDVSTNRFLPATATGSFCVGAQVSGKAGKPTRGGVFAAGAAPCQFVFCIKDEARSA